MSATALAERQLRSILGAEHAEQVIESSVGCHAGGPVLGTKLHVIDGLVIPQMAGGTGFSSLSDLVSEATVGGKRQERQFSKVGTVAVSGATEDLWYAAGFPTAGTVPPNITTQTLAAGVPTNAMTGALGQSDPAGADTLHLTTLNAVGMAGPNTLVLVDRLWQSRLTTITATTAQATAGTGGLAVTRYTGTGAAGNVLYAVAGATLGAATPTITFSYTNQAGTAAQAATATGISAAATGRFAHANPWVSLAAGDQGVRSVESVTLSASYLSGSLDFVIARPLAWLPLGAAGLGSILDGINSAFNLVQILTGAALSFVAMKGVATATTYAGSATLVSG